MKDNHSLPTSLKDLTLINIKARNYEILADLPQTLLKLNIQCVFDNVSIPDKITRYLPENLTILLLNTRQKFTDTFLDNLPQNLISLSILGKTMITGSGFENLPKGLNKLNLNGSAVNGKYFTFLPNTLTDLIVDNAVVNDEHIALLPRNLRLLSLCSDENITDDGISKLPENLEFLNLERNRKISNLSLFPRKLLHLDLSGALSLYSFSSLPESLKSFYSRSPTITDEEIPHLPRELKILTLDASKLSNESLFALPPLITNLSLINSKFTEVHALPQNLNSLHLPSVGFSKCKNIDTPYLTRLTLAKEYGRTSDDCKKKWKHLNYIHFTPHY